MRRRLQGRRSDGKVVTEVESVWWMPPPLPSSLPLECVQEKGEVPSIMYGWMERLSPDVLLLCVEFLFAREATRWASTCHALSFLGREPMYVLISSVRVSAPHHEPGHCPFHPRFEPTQIPPTCRHTLHWVSEQEKRLLYGDPPSSHDTDKEESRSTDIIQGERMSEEERKSGLQMWRQVQEYIRPWWSTLASDRRRPTYKKSDPNHDLHLGWRRLLVTDTYERFRGVECTCLSELVKTPHLCSDIQEIAIVGDNASSVFYPVFSYLLTLAVPSLERLMIHDRSWRQPYHLPKEFPHLKYLYYDRHLVSLRDTRTLCEQLSSILFPCLNTFVIQESVSGRMEEIATTNVKEIATTNVKEVETTTALGKGTLPTFYPLHWVSVSPRCGECARHHVRSSSDSGMQRYTLLGKEFVHYLETLPESKRGAFLTFIRKVPTLKEIRQGISGHLPPLLFSPKKMGGATSHMWYMCRACVDRRHTWSTFSPVPHCKACTRPLRPSWSPPSVRNKNTERDTHLLANDLPQWWCSSSSSRLCKLQSEKWLIRSMQARHQWTLSYTEKRRRFYLDLRPVQLDPSSSSSASSSSTSSASSSDGGYYLTLTLERMGKRETSPHRTSDTLSQNLTFLQRVITSWVHHKPEVSSLSAARGTLVLISTLLNKLVDFSAKHSLLHACPHTVVRPSHSTGRTLPYSDDSLFLEHKGDFYTSFPKLTHTFEEERIPDTEVLSCALSSEMRTYRENIRTSLSPSLSCRKWLSMGWNTYPTTKTLKSLVVVVSPTSRACTFSPTTLLELCMYIPCNHKHFYTRHPLLSITSLLLLTMTTTSTRSIPPPS